MKTTLLLMLVVAGFMFPYHCTPKTWREAWLMTVPVIVVGLVVFGLVGLVLLQMQAHGVLR